VAAPAVILSIVLDWNLTLTVLAIGLPTAVYTMFGCVQAVTWTDVKQMVVIIAGVGRPSSCCCQLPQSVGGALHIAGSTGRMQALDFRWDPSKTYTFWSGLIGGLFLMLSYFGCDQSQVQRYLTAKSVDEGRQSLLMSAYFKIPLQFLIPMIGVLMFVFYLFHQPPVLFNRQHDATVLASARAGEYRAMEQEFAAAFETRRAAAALARRRRQAPAASDVVAAFRERGRVPAVRARHALVRSTGDHAFGDVNYVF
jgi:Na+/proline symporter